MLQLFAAYAAYSLAYNNIACSASQLGKTLALADGQYQTLIAQLFTLHASEPSVGSFNSNKTVYSPRKRYACWLVQQYNLASYLTQQQLSV